MSDSMLSVQTVPLSEFVRARVASGPVAMPVDGAIYARLRHITAVPAGTYREGYSLNRLQTLDSIIERVKNLHSEYKLPEEGLKAQQESIEKAAAAIAQKIESGRIPASMQLGLVFDTYR